MARRQGCIINLILEYQFYAPLVFFWLSMSTGLSLHVTPGGHDGEGEEEDHQLAQVEGIVQHVRYEQDDQEYFENEKNHQPRQQQ